MKSWVQIICAAILCFMVTPSETPGRGFGGFHGGGFSGGGFHAGGYGGGGFHAGGFEGGGYHAGGYGGGGFGDYHAGGFEAGGYHAGGTESYHGGYANRGQLNSFLGMPTDGGMHAASHAGGYAASPEGLAAGRAGAHGGVYEGPGGTEVAHGGAGARGVAAGPGGAAAGEGYVHGTAVKGPDGNVYYHGGAAGRGAAAGPEGVAAGGGAVHGSAVQGAGGNTYYRGGAAGRGYAAGAGGAVARGGAVYGRGYATASGTHYWSATACHAQAIGVQGWYGAHPAFTPAWSATGAWAWHPAGYTVAAWSTAAWQPCTWPAIGAWFNWSAPPYDYTYGNNITYVDNSVYYGSQPAGTAAQYYQEASDLAETGAEAQPTEDAQWLPLGVFGLVIGQEKKPAMTFQLAVNKSGLIRGNCLKPPSDTAQAVQGAVDKKTQRVAWGVKDEKNFTIDTGIYNLTKDEASALLHRGPDKTEQVLLVRVKQSPAAQGQQ